MILHADLDSFYASVEQRDDPSLRGKPVIVGGGVVLAASYEAKAFGVHTPMGGREARALCPDAIVVSPRFEAYTDASKAVFEIFERTSPVVEGISVDEAFLDVTGLRRAAGEPVDIAARLRREVREQVGLPITVGIARTKHLAKVASAAAKPDGLLLVSPSSEDAFLHPLPVQKLWGVGPKTTEKLRQRGITHVRDLAHLGEGPLVSMLGPHAGRHLFALATNRDPRHVVVGRRRGSIGSQCAIGWRDHTHADIDAVLVGIVDRVTRRMRKADRLGRTVTLRLRFVDWGRATRATTLLQPTADTDAVLAAARDLLGVAWPIIEERGCTLIGLSVGNLGDRDTIQLALPLDGSPDTAALDAAMDDVRARFGTSAVTRAVLLGRDTGTSVPMLPD